MKLHLGCGFNYKEGYVNVDGNKDAKADVYSDISNLKLEDESCSEILIEHTLEHFDRPTVLGLLIKMHSWLKPGGKLVAVTPDIDISFSQFLSADLNYADKQRILRHCYGSHENDLAVHKDGWCESKFRYVLTELGFSVTRIDRLKVLSNPPRYDIRVEAIKSDDTDVKLLIERAIDLIKLSLFDNEEYILNFSIKKLLSVVGEKLPKKIIALFFSKDRAMQLDLALRTFKEHCLKPGLDIKVLYKCSDINQKNLYLRLTDHHPDVFFYEETDFRNNFFYLIDSYDFVLLSTDDSVYCRDFDVDDAIDALRDDRVIGFSLRLGKNITKCYMVGDIDLIQPDFESRNNYLVFEWNKYQYDFSYPMELSSSIYRTDDILNLSQRIPFHCPNVLEFWIDNLKTELYGRDLLACYPTSVAFCNALNVVQNVYMNRHGNVSAELLSNLFHAGYRMKNNFDGFIPSACHHVCEIEVDNFNMSETPLLSVIIPTHNCFERLRDAVNSVLRNTNSPFELIVISNTDNKRSKEYLSKHRLIKIIENESNVGAACARNQGLRVAKGKYIAFVDDDVIVCRNWDSKFISYFEKNPSVGMIGSVSNCASGIQVVSDGKYDNIYEYELFAEKFRQYDRYLVPSIRVASFCVIVTRDLVDAIGGMDESLSKYGFEDDDYSFRAYIAGFNPSVAYDIFVHHFGGLLYQGNKEYLEEYSKACKAYKSKWNLSDSPEGYIDYTEIVKNKFDKERYFIPL